MIKELPKWFRIAKITSEQSDYKYKVGAVLVKGGSVVSTGYNEVRFKSLGSEQYTEWKESLHAERAAIAKMNKEDVQGCSMYIYREYNSNNFPALSKPCSQCAKLISDMGVKKVYYTTPGPPYYQEIKL